jgi:signal transduction histidine kinase
LVAKEEEEGMARKRGSAQSSGYTILVIDDQEEILISLRLLLEREGHKVLTASSGEEGLTLLRSERVHLVIVDYFMPGMSGEKVVRKIRQLDDEAQVQILLQTGYSGEKPPLEMMRALDIQGYHSKTDGPEHLLLWVEVMLKAATQLQHVREAEQLKAELQVIKQQFLANTSHEMRTPLHLILGHSEMLLEKGGTLSLPAHVRQAVEVIHRQGQTLSELITEFLNAVQFEAEGMLMNFEPVALMDLQHELQDMMGVLLRYKPVSFFCQVPSHLPLVWADREKLLMILHNALTNAAKFTSHGEIRLTASPLPSGKVMIQITDTGVGIAPEQHQAVLRMLHQRAEGPLTSLGDVGIGLLLSHKLARLMSGELSLTSVPGTGTTFTVTLKSFPGEVHEATSNSAPIVHDAREEPTPCLSPDLTIASPPVP